jgi:hypothetical protein
MQLLKERIANLLSQLGDKTLKPGANDKDLVSIVESWLESLPPARIFISVEGGVLQFIESPDSLARVDIIARQFDDSFEEDGSIYHWTPDPISEESWVLQEQLVKEHDEKSEALNGTSSQNNDETSTAC